ncbi:peroxiredoxin family protein [Pullulanibacillus pueri]|uniref:Beta-lactamase class A catalytic domain-containing protein n=1 Tax=Pullulanibacillus pueri TaxID=1437324 RepID=A0A8J2ZYS4_9BACL|nr:serine hydrolase [Pullulanibacillus pueri]MBM7683766.1 peroxiredoxin family protein [Pullulanibacillus pueri]GGH87305.1 hypothetical protein GCM10007096_37020 [Pullulanibacillus pueri]
MLVKNIERMIQPGMRFGFYFSDLHEGTVITFNEDEWFPLASLTKMITAVLSLRNTKRFSGTVIQNTISHHSQQAYETLLEKQSVGKINQQLVALQFDIMTDQNHRDKEKNVGTPRGLYEFLSFISKENGLEAPAKDLIMKALREQADPDGFRLGGQWYHMTGGFDGVCNDIGYWDIQGRRLVIVGCLQTSDPSIPWTTLENTLQKVGYEIMKVYQSTAIEP